MFGGRYEGGQDDVENLKVKETGVGCVVGYQRVGSGTFLRVGPHVVGVQSDAEGFKTEQVDSELIYNDDGELIAVRPVYQRQDISKSFWEGRTSFLFQIGVIF